MINWVVTIHWPMSIEKRIYTAFEEAFEFACIIKKTVLKTELHSNEKGGILNIG